MQRVKLCYSYATKDTAPFRKRSCSEIRLLVLACGIGIWASVIRAGLDGADFAPPSALLKILLSGVAI